MLKKIYFLFTLFCTINLFAHPHTFIEIYPTIKVKNNKIININFKWKMDEMTSSMLIMEFDQNGNGKIDKKENFFIYGSYFLRLHEYNFYTDVKVKDKTQLFPKPKNFKATIDNHKICYTFDIETNYDKRDTKFDFGDEDFFVAMILKKEFVKVEGSDFKVTEQDNDFYFGYRLELK
ncbi:MAG: DUF1007 family protein [Campylobacterota bacterium]|nr:DUF1007 family protein [Campylobacterota bacterium]